ncbi:cellobiose phosphorylase [Paenibacillus woosongensis]|uniref:Cellobiose phosphorylase n=1 Tax=Paenibacillus woosongensis TaxID=307580 RepID=A0A7X2Z357_9BACL|nr:cellobiose phosphorylase [Paenibacillus woosongensis]MUG45934.1 cellobiose phosphorylase [Paenibacillus woosongensis]
MSNYSFDQNAFVIKQFDKAKPFSSFLPGLAGLKGIPMWTFYVNRGQAVCSFGIRDKKSPIMEFSPASITYQSVTSKGFRTFIKREGAKGIYEPFQSAAPDAAAERKMVILPNEIGIEEVNKEQGTGIKVTYFQMPNDDYAALVRKVEITNISGEPMKLEVLDGLPEILPYGVDNAGYKEVGNLLRSWMEVYNLDNNIPYYRVRSSTSDSAEVSEVQSGHFYLSFGQDGKIVKPIVDFQIIFGDNTSLAYPDRFAERSLAELTAEQEYCTNKVPCGFTGLSVQLAAGETTTLYTLIGHIESMERLNEKAPSIASPAYIAVKQAEAGQLTEELTDDIATRTSSPLFDAYCRQSYMDNFLRGGYPFLFENGREGFVIHLYSRKHGDLERDYNFFSIAPEYYSQGNGNFRDANQNRRNDIYFNPRVGTFNIVTFFSLIQADGYNPLGVEGTSFTVPEQRAAGLREWVETSVSNPQIAEKLQALCLGKFTPGKVISLLADKSAGLRRNEEEILTGILSLAEQNIEAAFGEGYWSDHWTYNLDLIDGYLDIFPDRKEKLLFGEEVYTFFDSPARVLPRSEKYVINGTKVRQYGALEHDEEKMQRFGLSLNDTNWLKTKHGEGEIFRTNLFVKLISLSLNKFATLDPYGMGVEMEGDKPGWNDAMNGLPGLFGSGMSETFELKRIVKLVIEASELYGDRQVGLPEEMHELLDRVSRLMERQFAGELEQFDYWDQVAAAREQYRDDIRFGISGELKQISLAELGSIYKQMLKKIDQGIERAIELGHGLTPTYFVFEAVEYEPVLDAQGKPVISGYGLPKVVVKKFEAKPLPHFLEGPARWLKTIDDKAQAEKAYELIRQSDLFDKEIQMYKTSVSLDGESQEIGRIRAFTPGWLERESVFLHMSYKYLLALLKSGLYEQFFAEMKTSLIPFLDPAVYGRSTLENSSFIATSVNPDPHVHGRGFVARLSGSTAEFISMWIKMMMGSTVFSVNDGQLQLAFEPVLPGWLFDEQGKVAFKFLGSTQVTYHNPLQADTFGADKAMVERIQLMKKDGSTAEIIGSVIGGELAHEVRNGQVAAIDIYLK